QKLVSQGRHQILTYIYAMLPLIVLKILPESRVALHISCNFIKHRQRVSGNRPGYTIGGGRDKFESSHRRWFSQPGRYSCSALIVCKDRAISGNTCRAAVLFD